MAVYDELGKTHEAILRTDTKNKVSGKFPMTFEEVIDRMFA